MAYDVYFTLNERAVYPCNIGVGKNYNVDFQLLLDFSKNSDSAHEYLKLPQNRNWLIYGLQIFTVKLSNGQFSLFDDLDILMAVYANTHINIARPDNTKLLLDELTLLDYYLMGFASQGYIYIPLGVEPIKGGDFWSITATKTNEVLSDAGQVVYFLFPLITEANIKFFNKNILLKTK